MLLKEKERIAEGRCPKCGSKPGVNTNRCRRCNISLDNIPGRLENGDLFAWVELFFDSSTISEMAHGRISLLDAKRFLHRPLSEDRIYKCVGEDAKRILTEHALAQGLTNLAGLLLRERVSARNDKMLRQYVLNRATEVVAKKLAENTPQ